MTEFYKHWTTPCSGCGKWDQLYYKGNMRVCAECVKERARVYSKSKRGRVADRVRRRGVEGRGYYKSRLNADERREVLRKSGIAWKERNKEMDRERRKILARIYYKIKAGKIDRGYVCAECGDTGYMYIYIDWDKWDESIWIPEFTWVCSLCLGRHRQRS